jgi:hypothetical protein
VTNTSPENSSGADQPKLFDIAPSPAERRAELEKLVIGDLLGPAGGDREVLPGRSRVRDRYITGMLAPKRTVAFVPERKSKSDQFDGVGEASDDSASDDTTASATTDMFPSSMGLSFTTVKEPGTLLVTAGWGKYLKESIVDGEGEIKPTWQRYPVSGSVEIAIVEGELGPFPIVSEQPEVFVRGKAKLLPHGWLVTLFLVNDQTSPETNKDEVWLFQVKLGVQAIDSSPVFCGRSLVLDPNNLVREVDELAMLDLQYRNLVEFAVGHGVATHAIQSNSDPTRAVRVETASMPVHEVPVTEAPGANDPTLSPAVSSLLKSVVLDMSVLSALSGAELVDAVTPLVDAYDVWLDEQQRRLDAKVDGLGNHLDAATAAIEDARKTSARLRAGIATLIPENGVDVDASEAFRFTNQTMWQQRIHSLAAERRRNAPELDLAASLVDVDVPSNRSWRPFQLAFILLNLPSLTDPRHPERSRKTGPQGGLVDLLFFPTGGGKTEAYLGLTAYTLAIRRLQGVVGGRDGRSGGVAVLMRYTLRLLTAQQFERAAALICACEIRRRELIMNDERWGVEPFRLGMWVGANVTPNRTRDAAIAVEDGRSGGRPRSGNASPVQLVTCPWCGTRLDAARDAKSDPDRWRTLLFCGDAFGNCAFTEAGSPREGLPVVTVDEEMYRLLPSFVISTADKFAQLPWRGPLHMLFGQVSKRCERHGYRSADLDTMDTTRPEADSHNRRGSLPAARTVDVDPLRPPDLIIQDELHLISGPLGTLVGLYETAIDELATWELDGHAVRPKVIASTATVRRAAQQAHALFDRHLQVFPPPVLDVSDSFFAKERSISERPGRRYLGLCATGLRLKSAEVRLFSTLLSSTQHLYDRYGQAADPWMTLVGYFSALRELAGMRRLVDDEVKTNARKAKRRGLGNRTIHQVQELTSRVGSSEIRDVLDWLKQTFDPAQSSGKRPIDVLLATNMISVGVDVSRLGLMTTIGQPKTTSEYIQATSRVGRDKEGPGLVITLYNWARPRDLSHYETFEHYHSTFYRQVEALSVTPFSPRALDRGLSAVLVALARQSTSKSEWNPNKGAQEVDLAGPEIAQIVELIVQRAERVTSDPAAADFVRELLEARLDRWKSEQQRAGSHLGYQDDAAKGVVNLLEVPGITKWDTFTCAWSLRETEPTVNLIIDAWDGSLESAPKFELGKGTPRGTVANLSEDEEIDNEAEVFG